MFSPRKNGRAAAALRIPFFACSRFPRLLLLTLKDLPPSLTFKFARLSPPQVRLTRARTGNNGSALFVFENPSIFQASGELGDITGLFMVDDEGESAFEKFEKVLKLLILKLLNLTEDVTDTLTMHRAAFNAFQHAFHILTCLQRPASAGTLTTTDVKAKFVNGKPASIEARFNMRSQFEWDRFMRFMDRYAQDNGLGFEKGQK